MLRSLISHYKAAQIAEAWASQRAEALKILADVLDYMGFSPQFLLEDPTVDRLLRVSQLLDQVQIFRTDESKYPKGSALEEFTLRLALLTSPGDKEELLSMIREVTTASQNNSDNRKKYVTEEIMKMGALPFDADSCAAITYAVQVLSLNAMQIVAIAFNDDAAVLALQEEKVTLQPGPA